MDPLSPHRSAAFSPGWRLAATVVAASMLALSLRAEDAATGSVGTHWSSVTAEDLARARTIAAERRRHEESYIRAPADDDVIVLAPYVVKGDDSLVQARLRRDLERGFGYRPRPQVGLEALTQRRTDFPRKSDYLFFNGPSPGAPADRPNAVDWLGLSVGIVSAIAHKRVGDIFRAPPGVADQ